MNSDGGDRSSPRGMKSTAHSDELIPSGGRYIENSLHYTWEVVMQCHTEPFWSIN